MPLEFTPRFIRLRLLQVVAVVLVLVPSVLNGVQAEAEDSQTIVHRHDVSPRPPQQWQIRRGDFFRALTTANQGQSAEQDQARAKVSAAVEMLKADEASLTPMEGMDIYGAILLPGSGDANLKAMLGGIATLATLGWYDALRFTDDSGRAEIYGNERFFTRALEMAGGVKRMVDFLSGHPDEAADAVKAGIDRARGLRDAVHYDPHWPSAYGLAPMLCGMSVDAKTKDCKLPFSIAPDKWPAAFDEAAELVTHYYRDNSSKK
jgi:hypothetical protein